MKISNHVPSIPSQSPVPKQVENETMTKNAEEHTRSTPKRYIKHEPKIPIDSFKWVESIRIYQPEKFVEAVTLNKEKSLTGYPDVTILPHGLSVKEYYAQEARKAEQELD